MAETKTMTKEQLVDSLRPLIVEGLKGELKDVIQEHLATMLAPTIQRADTMEALLGTVARQVAPAAPVAKTGDLFAKYARAVAVSAIDKCKPEDVAKQWNDTALLKVIEEGRVARAERKSLSTVTGADGGFLVPEQLSTDVIEFLRPMSVVRAAGPETIRMPSGTIRLPKMTGGSAASYIGELQNIGTTQPVFGQVVLSFKKLAALVPFSNDLLRYAAMDSQSIIRTDLVRAMAQRENQAFLTDVGTASTPKGLRQWALAANVTASAGTWVANVANQLADLGALILSLRNANVPMTRPVWFMNPTTWQRLMITQTTTGAFVYRDEMKAGTLWGWPFGVTTQIAANGGVGANESEVYLVDMADVVIGEAMNLILEGSTETAYWDGSQMLSAFQRDETVIRAIQEHDFAVRREQSVAVKTGVIA